VALFIISVYLDVWSRLNVIASGLLSVASVFLFLWDYLVYEGEGR
jgi:hypothetical protein